MRSVIYIDRTNLYYYGGNVHTIVTFPFPPTSVIDLEIVNEEELATQIQEWLKTHKIEPTSAIILLSNNCFFQKEIPLNTPPDKIEELKKSFVDNVPFNDTLIHEITFVKSHIVVVINKDFVYTIRDIFQGSNFKIEAIAPSTQIYGLQPITSFTPSVAQEALKKISSSNEQLFPVHEIEETTTSLTDETPPSQKPNSNTRIYILAGVFVVLIGILVYVLVVVRGKPKKTRVRITPTPATVVTTTAPPAGSPSASLSSTTSIAKKDLTIQVLNGSGVAGQADEVRKGLEDENFENITTGNAPTVQSTKTLIIFKPEVSQKDREDIINILEDIVDEVSTQEKNDTDFDVLITTSQSSQNTPSPTP